MDLNLYFFTFFEGKLCFWVKNFKLWKYTMYEKDFLLEACNISEILEQAYQNVRHLVKSTEWNMFD